MTLKLEYIEVTPELAKKFLASNVPNNRNVRESLVDKYARDMRDHRWSEDNGEPIKFNERGEMVDGQHRCEAIVRSGVPVWSVIVSGVSDGAIDTIDIGAPRSIADMLRIMDGIPNGRRIATISGTLLIAAGNTRPTKPEVADFARDYLDELAKAVAATSGSGRLFGSCKIVGAAAFLIAMNTDVLTNVDPWVAVNEFFAALDTGANLAVDNPILVLRNKFLRKPELAKARFYSSTHDVLAMIFHAWNLWIKGERRSKFASSHPTPSTLYVRKPDGRVIGSGPIDFDWRI